MLFHRIEGVGNGDRRSGVADLDGDRIGQDVVGKFVDVRRHGGREQQGLPFGGDLFQYPADIGEKTHVKHLVGFVQHQYFEVGEVDGALADVVQQTARAGHHDFNAVFERLNLRIDVDSTIHGDTLQSGLFRPSVNE